MLACGLSDAEVATRLGISVATVRTYLIRLYRDNDLSNRTQAVAVWLGSYESGASCEVPSHPTAPKANPASRSPSGVGNRHRNRGEDVRP
jgi:hypothetical protein